MCNYVYDGRKAPSIPKDLISIIIPAYNIGDMLCTCVETVLAQTHRNIEVIIVNDGSKDNTSAVMEQLATLDSRVIAIHKENGGVTSARLTGVRAAKGNWIGFIDGDDQIEPHMFAQLLNNALKYDADISHCGYQMIFPSRVDYYYNTGRIVEQTHETALKDLIDGKFVEPALCTKLYRRSLFNKLLDEQLMDPTIRNFEDLLMNFYLFRESQRAVFEDICPYHYILRQGSAATGKSTIQKILGPLRVFRAIEQEASSNPPILSHIRVRILSYLITLSTRSAGNNRELMLPIRKQSRKELRSLLPVMKINPICDKKLFLMGLLAGYFPCGYQMIHWFHSRIAGNNKKYEVK